MRRALLAVLAAGTLLTGAACSSDASDDTTEAPVAAPPSPSPSVSLEPDHTADTRQVCTRMQSIYQGELRDLGTALGKMITYKEAKETAEAKKAENAAAAELTAVAKKIRQETARADDPEVKRAGALSAAKFEASAKDRGYFAKVKTLKDLNTTIEGQLSTWLTPVAGHCTVPAAAPSGTPSAGAPASGAPTPGTPTTPPASPDAPATGSTP